MAAIEDTLSARGGDAVSGTSVERVGSLTCVVSCMPLGCPTCHVAGLYSLMLGYVMVTLSQHMTPALLGMSFVTAIGP